MRITLLAIIAIFVLSLGFGAFTTVPEGHRGVVLRYQSAQPNPMVPGLNFKTPFIDSVVEIDIRQQKTSKELAATSKNQQPIQSTVSINWSVNTESTVEFYSQYGTLERFSEKILDPAIQQAAKDAIAKFDTKDLVQQRGQLADRIQETLVDKMRLHPVTIHSPQIENLILPPKYLAQVERTQVANEARRTAEFELETQETVQQQKVQAAEAEANSKIEQARGEAKAVEIAAEAEAKRILIVATAEAQSIELRGEAEAKAQELKVNAFNITCAEDEYCDGTTYGEYLSVDKWNGVLPTTMPPDASVPFLRLHALGQ